MAHLLSSETYDRPKSSTLLTSSSLASFVTTYMVHTLSTHQCIQHSHLAGGRGGEAHDRRLLQELHRL